MRGEAERGVRRAEWAKRLSSRGIQPTMRQGSLVALVMGVLLVMSCAGEARSSQTRRGSNRPGTVVLELFTSQGCSSCPPADELLSTLRREDFGGRAVVALAYHVDYWNSLGWSDPFSSARWSQRQREYAQVIRGAQVYTPQLVINGKVQLVGSAEGAIRAEIARQLDGEDRGAVFIDHVVRSGNQVKVDLRARLNATKGGRASVVVVLFEDGITTAVSRGENARRNLVNDAIVRWQDHAVDLDASGVEASASISIPLEDAWRADHLGVAVFIQDARSRAIYASAARSVVVR